MNRYRTAILCCLMAMLVFSCKKNNETASQGEAVWVKVIADSAVYMPGRIRADARNNLYCSYDHRSYNLDTNSVLVKLDSLGNIAWRKEFTDLSIYDFVVTNEGNSIIASFDSASGAVFLTEITTDNIRNKWGSFVLESDVATIRIFQSLRIMTNSVGNFILSGSFLYHKGSTLQWLGFIAEFDGNGNVLWGNAFYLSNASPRPTITGCAETDGGYLVFGNRQYQIPYLVSSFFISKVDQAGTVLWTKIDTTSRYDAAKDSFSGYYCNTSNLIASADGNSFFGCAYNERYNIAVVNPIYTSDDMSVRVFKFNAEGDTIDSQKIHVAIQQLVTDFVLMEDGGLLLGINPFKIATGIYYTGQQNSSIARLSADLNIESLSNIQTQYMDYTSSVCALRDGHYAIESIIQSFGGGTYKLEVIKTDENGNY